MLLKLWKLKQLRFLGEILEFNDGKLRIIVMEYVFTPLFPASLHECDFDEFCCVF
jgi:hypothetical protein